MAISLNLDTGELRNKSIILEGNSPLLDSHIEILKNYETIYIGYDFNQSLGRLPKCIRAIRFNIYDEYYYNWNTTNRCHGNTVLKEFAFNQPLDNLHNELEYLELYGTNCQELHNLPTSLKYLIIYWRCNISLGYLPESLEILYLDFIKLTYEGQSNLPRKLKELYLNGGMKGTIYALPNELKLLYINGIYTSLDKFIELPEKLETFIFYDSEWSKENKRIIKWLFKNKKMPKSLKRCIFPIHYADIFSDLKVYAKQYIDFNIDWKFIDIYPDKLVEHIKIQYK